MKIFICLFITLCFSSQCFSQMKYSLNSGENNVSWYVKEHHKKNFSTKVFNEAEWIPATVPGTIFVDAVNAGLEKDPNFGDNIYQVDKDKYNKEHIYRLEFNIPENKDLAQKRIWLNFDGINRFGEIYLNNSVGIRRRNLQIWQVLLICQVRVGIGCPMSRDLIQVLQIMFI